MGLPPFPITICRSLRLSSAASSFFWISSNDTSFFFGGDRGNSGPASFERGLMISSKACPEARFSSSFTWISGNGGIKPEKQYLMQELAQVTLKTAFQNSAPQSSLREGIQDRSFVFSTAILLKNGAIFFAILPRSYITQAPDVLFSPSTSQAMKTSSLVQIKNHSLSSDKPEDEFPGVCLEPERAKN